MTRGDWSSVALFALAILEVLLLWLACRRPRRQYRFDVDVARGPDRWLYTRIRPEFLEECRRRNIELERSLWTPPPPDELPPATYRIERYRS